jgi:DNA polymerase-3 subunit gamma/tau
VSYVSLARRYRPQRFQDVVGQEHITTTLLNAVRLKKISHAYLFSGPRGTGKTTTARILAKSINCQYSEDGEPCNNCITCKEITSGNSLDIVEIDGASNRGIDEIRQLRENVKSCSVRARFKVYIIDEVHMLTEQAFNALLKTLEEPPAHVVFVFATTEPQKVPATILSRCQRFGFRRIPKEIIFSHLQKIATKENILIQEEALDYISGVVEGSLRDAQVVLEQAYAYCRENKEISLTDVMNLLGIKDKRSLIKLLELIQSGSVKEALRYFYEILADGSEITSICLGLMELCRDIILFKINSLYDEPNDYLNQLSKLSQSLEVNHLFRLFNNLRVLNERLRYFPNQAKILFDIFIIRSCIMINSQERSAKAEVITTTWEEREKERLKVPEKEENKRKSFDIVDIFERVKSELKEERPVIYHSLTLCKVKEFMNNKLKLEIDKSQSFQRELLQKPENIQLIEKKLEDYTGDKIEVELSMKDTDFTQDEALVSKILDIFGGKIIK